MATGGGVWVAAGAQPFQKFIYQRLEWVRKMPQLPILLRSREIEELLDTIRISSHKHRLEKALGKRFEDDPYLFHFYFGGVNRILREWLGNGCQESSREIADTVISLTRSFVLSNRGAGRSQ